MYQVTICHPKFHDGSTDGSTDGLGYTQDTPDALDMSPPSAPHYTVPPERDLAAYLRKNGS